MKQRKKEKRKNEHKKERMKQRKKERKKEVLSIPLAIFDSSTYLLRNVFRRSLACSKGNRKTQKLPPLAENLQSVSNPL